MSQTIYKRRQNAMSRGEREWRVEDDALVSRGARGDVQRTPWRAVACVRVAHAPTRLKPWRHVFELRLRDGRKIVLDNGHFVAMSNFEDRSESYTPFVRAALEKIHQANPKARALVGESPWRYAAYLVAALVGLVAAATAIMLAPTPLDALPFAGLVKLALVLLMLPGFAYWILKAFPRGSPLDSVPERALPSVSVEQQRAA
jgi:hypothetical protein